MTRLQIKIKKTVPVSGIVTRPTLRDEWRRRCAILSSTGKENLDLPRGMQVARMPARVTPAVTGSFAPAGHCAFSQHSVEPRDLPQPQLTTTTTATRQS